jgi:hypothetical protein
LFDSAKNTTNSLTSAQQKVLKQLEDIEKIAARPTAEPTGDWGQKKNLTLAPGALTQRKHLASAIADLSLYIDRLPSVVADLKLDLPQSAFSGINGAQEFYSAYHDKLFVPGFVTWPYKGARAASDAATKLQDVVNLYAMTENTNTDLSTNIPTV